MLEDMSCLLGSGEVPNLFTPDEEADIVVRVRDAVRATGKPDTRVSEILQSGAAFAPKPHATTTTTTHYHAYNQPYPPLTQKHGEKTVDSCHENQREYFVSGCSCVITITMEVHSQ